MKIENNTLTIEEPSNAKTLLTVLAILLVILGPCACTAYRKEDGESLAGILFISVVFLALALGSRSLRCVMDKNTGKIIYERGGILDMSLGQSHAEYPFSAVEKVEVKRFISRGRDSFECRVVLKDDKTLRVSPSGIGLSQCEHFARKVHEFLEVERALAFVD